MLHDYKTFLLEYYQDETRGVKKGEKRDKIKPSWVIITSVDFTFEFRYHRKDADPWQYAGLPADLWAMLDSRSVILVGSGISEAGDLKSVKLEGAIWVDSQVVADWQSQKQGLFLKEDKLGIVTVAKGLWHLDFDIKQDAQGGLRGKDLYNFERRHWDWTKSKKVVQRLDNIWLEHLHYMFRDGSTVMAQILHFVATESKKPGVFDQMAKMTEREIFYVALRKFFCKKLPYKVLNKNLYNPAKELARESYTEIDWTPPKPTEQGKRQV
jgi:hypothetical protein